MTSVLAGMLGSKTEGQQASHISKSKSEKRQVLDEEERRMRILAAALLEEACRRTGPRLEQARNASFKSHTDCQDALRRATATGRKMLLEADEVPSEAGSKVPRATPIELLQALAEVESAAQYLLSREVETKEDDEEILEADELGSFATPLMVPRKNSTASIGSTVTTQSSVLERKTSWVRQLFAPKTTEEPSSSSSSSAPASASASAFRQVPMDGEFRELVLEGEPRELVDGMIQEWSSSDSALLNGEQAALEQLARDAAAVAQAVAMVNDLTVQGGEQLDLVEANASYTEANTREGLKSLLVATEGAEKTQGMKTAITASAALLVVGLLGGAPIVPAVALGVAAAPIGWGTSRLVQRKSRRRLRRYLARREGQQQEKLELLQLQPQKFEGSD